MFFFTADLDKINREGLRTAFGAGKRFQKISEGSHSLFWSADPFTQLSKNHGRITISLKRPRLDKTAICDFSWDLKSAKILVRRQWSGEFSVYFGRQPALMIASHLRLAAGAHDGLPPGIKPLKAGFCLRANASEPAEAWRLSSKEEFRRPFALNRKATAAKLKTLLFRSVAQQKGRSALLLSGGIDSAAIAAAAVKLQKNVSAFVFSAERAEGDRDTDRHYAHIVARHLRIPLTEICLQPRSLVRNVQEAVALAETSRGTIIDICTALIDVAQMLHRNGYRTVWFGEGADALFGGFTFALRYQKGQALKAYCRHHLTTSLPDELAILQRIFARWNIALIFPFWTRGLMEMGYNLPLSYRFDVRRLMKPILRAAFRNMLPAEIVKRPKAVPRDSTGVRIILEAQFGRSRNRYRPIFRESLAGNCR